MNAPEPTPAPAPTRSPEPEYAPDGWTDDGYRGRVEWTDDGPRYS